MSTRRSQVYNNLAHLVAAGVPIVRAARTSGTGMRGKVARAMVEISREMDQGSTIGEAMRKRPRIFPPLDAMVVEVSDTSGDLPEGLKMLAGWYELMARVKRTVISGMALPILVLNIAAFVSPIPQVAIGGMGLAGYIRQVVTILLAFYIPIAAIVVMVKLSGTGGTARLIIDAIALRIPILGSAIRDSALSRYCLAVSMMSRAGVSAASVAQSASELTGNAVMGGRLAGAVESVKQGNLFSEGFSRRLPADFLEMWKVGEETGDIDESTARMARSYEESAERKFIELARWLPRMFYFLVCLMMIRMIFTMAGYVTGMIKDASSGF